MSGASYITRIKCRNFKSFKSVDVDLIRGFQAFIGPNGSGKSNITDAIRFGIGETKLSALRAKGIRELINHDGEFAEVTLVIDTREGEISVSRRVNKEGKSWYRLNGKKATRSSIVEVLKRHYIENGTHNVIGQGEVQKIVNMSPVERRKVIDEIAGVAEFDLKKNEAMRELDTVQQRINDTKLILKEREGFIASLEKERESALKYIDVKRKVVNLRNSIIYHEVRKVEEDYEKSTREYAMCKARIGEIERAIGRLSEKISVEGKRISELSDEINKSSTNNKEYREFEALRTELALLAQKSEMLTARRSDAENRVKELELKKGELEGQIAGFDSGLTEKEERMRKARDELQELKRVAEMSKKRDSTLVSESQRLGSEVAQIENNVDAKEEEINGLALSVSQAEYRLGEGRKEIERLESASDGKAVLDEMRGIEREIKSLEKELEAKRKGLDQLFARERKCNEQNAEIDRELLKLKDEFSRYKGVSAHMHSETVLRFIRELKERGAVSGIYGSVQELCSFDQKYSIAIESAVGGRLNHIIVENLDSSREAIEQLRKKKVGRATFLPLNMKLGDTASKGMNFPGVLGRLIDFIEFDSKFSAPMHYVFGDTVLITDIETAKDIGLVGKARLVTLEGDIIDRSSAVTGGHFTSSMKLGERKRALELEAKIEKMQAEKEGLITSLYALRDEASLARRERSEIEVRIKGLQIELGAMARSAGEVKDREEKLKQARSSVSELERALKIGQAELERSKSAASKLKEKLAIMRKRKGEIDLALFSRNPADEEKIAGLTEEVSRIEAELKGSEKEALLLKERIDDLGKDIAGAKGELRDVENGLLGAEKDSERVRAEMEIKRAEIDKAGKRIRSLIAKRDEVQATADILAEEKGSLAGTREREMQELGKIETRKAVLEQRLVDLKSEGGNEEFELIEGSITKMKGELREREAELEGIGSVNLLAPQMYEEKKREYDEVSEKLGRLEKEREAVIGMIEEVEKRKTTVFIEAFEKVNKNFSELFTQTFSEGSASLSLQKPGDPFSGGLEVRIVRVPGREERLEGLSGGEKSIIALLLVFSMHMYKPSAFYILDEVEDALDKMRSKLVAELLRKLSGKTQFIVVSHNDAVISSAESVVGVSRTAAGSRVISLALNEALAKASSARKGSN